MKNLQLLFITLIFLLLNSISLITSAAQNPDSTLLSTYEDDLTDDGHKETIQLKGILFSDEGNYYQDVWLEVVSKHSERWKIPFGGGYEPQVQILDLNNDNIDDIFYQSAASDSDQLYSHHLYSLKHGTIKEIPLPEQLYMKGHFKDNFQVQIQTSIKKSDKPLIIDVKERADEYMKLGLYNTQGELVEPAKVIIAPIALYEPILISKSKGYGLKSYQKVSRANHQDELGSIETLWYFENGNWIILQTDWLPSH